VQIHIPNLAWIVAAYLLVLAIVSVYLLCRLWPPSEQLKEEEGLGSLLARYRCEEKSTSF